MVVRRRAGSDTEFTVAVVHGATPGRAELVVPFRPQRIFGVSEGIKDDTVMPLHCADCDANVWYRWNGRAYEPRLHAVGESIRIGGEPGRRSTLFANPLSDASRTGGVRPAPGRRCRKSAAKLASAGIASKWSPRRSRAAGCPSSWRWKAWSARASRPCPSPS